MLFLRNLFHPRFAPTAVRVALLVGTLLLGINHGKALLRGEMTGERWVSALLSYCVPYIVNIHGQSIARGRDKS